MVKIILISLLFLSSFSALSESDISIRQPLLTEEPTSLSELVDRGNVRREWLDSLHATVDRSHDEEVKAVSDTLKASLVAGMPIDDGVKVLGEPRPLDGCCSFRLFKKTGNMLFGRICSTMMCPRRTSFIGIGRWS